MFEENRENMAKNINRFLERKGVTAAKLCDDLHIPPATFSDWRHGRTYPRIDKIELMSNYFGCTKADLVEDPMYSLKEAANKKYFNDRIDSLLSNLDSDEDVTQIIRLIELFTSLNEDERYLVIGKMDSIIQKKKKVD